MRPITTADAMRVALMKYRQLAGSGPWGQDRSQTRHVIVPKVIARRASLIALRARRR